jgi:hypothetical protein
MLTLVGRIAVRSPEVRIGRGFGFAEQGDSGYEEGFFLRLPSWFLGGVRGRLADETRRSVGAGQSC